MGIALTAADGMIADFTNIPSDLLFYAGLVLFPIALFMAVTAKAMPHHTLPVRLIVLGNWCWSIASLALLVTGLIVPNMIGMAFILAQAIIVAGFAILEQRAMPAFAMRG